MKKLSIREVIEIPVRGVKAGEKVGRIFENNPKYYMRFSLEFPQDLFQKLIPVKGFSLHITDEKTKFDKDNIKRKRLKAPSIEQVLWTIGYGSLPFVDLVAKKPVQFLHEPLEGKGQIRISLKEGMYFVEVVPIGDISSNILSALWIDFDAY